MKSSRWFGALVILLVFVGPLAILGAGPGASDDNGRVRKIVIFNTTVNDEAARGLLKHFGATIIHDLPLVTGKAVLMPPAAVGPLGARPEVVRIDDDAVVYALPEGKAPKPTPTPAPEKVDWGVNRIDADLVWPTGNTGAGIKVAVIDTGIDKDHPDLVANIQGGMNFVATGIVVDPNAWDDDNGHGTHVAGIIAAVDNTIGVVGVAPQAYLHAVKVLNRQGSGYVSDVIAGIQWAVNSGMQVVNMSLGTNSDIQSLHDACDSAYGAGLVLVAAAGNDGDTNPDNDVDYPARYSSVIAVAATDKNDVRASWSSDGSVELAAPGVSIYSTYKGGGYKTLSGTSMAAPHVAGTVALALASGRASTPDGVRALLRSTADDLGTTGFDTWYGYGLVDAQEAATGIQTNP